MGICVCIWRLEIDVICLPQSLSTLVFERGFLTEHRACWLTRLAASLDSGILLSLPAVLGFQGHITTLSFHMGAWGLS